MYHMAMPPQFGSTHPPTMHSSLSVFPGPLIPPGNHSVHSFSPQANGGSTVEMPTSAMLHTSPVISQGSSFYTHQPSVYVNPYLGGQSPIQMPNIISHPAFHNTPHPHNLGYSSATSGVGMYHGNHSDRQAFQDRANHHAETRRQPLSVDEELLEEMNTLHLGYLETEDSPHKMEQREKLENVILEYLAITPHSHKYIFHQVVEVLEKSILSNPNFDAHDAACAFDALAQYAANLISQPWRKEFREVKLHNGFWVHQVASQLTGAESILELMGYVCVSSKSRVVSHNEPSSSRMTRSPEHYVLQGVIDPDLITRLALDCMIAYCECQCLNKIRDGVLDYGISWGQLLQFRKFYVGGVDVTLRHLLFTLRQRVNPPLPYAAHLSPNSSLPNSPPPVPARQGSSFAAACKHPFPPSTKASTPTGGTRHSPSEPKLEASASVDDSLSKSGHRSPDCQKRSLSLTGGLPSANSSAPTKAATKQGHSKPSYTEDKVDGAHCLSSGSQKGGLSSRVPTAKLIDLDMSNENASQSKSNHHMLPKVLPHKNSSKNFTHHNSGNWGVPEDEAQWPPPAQPPPEAFKSGTLDEHLEATLNLVKNPLRNSTQTPRDSDPNSWETWDFVFKRLESKGYNKDIGDRGDILHEMTRQKTYSDANNASSGKNVNLNLNNQRKELSKSRPLTINQALHQFNQHETKDKGERPPSSKSSHSISHAYVHESRKRNSLYDNVSGGFETANQDSEGSEDRRPAPLKKINNASRQEASHRLENFSRNCDTSSTSHISADAKDSSPKPKATEVVQASGGENIWACVTCTYENKIDVTICEMCGKSRDPGPDSRPPESGGKQCPLCTLINDRNVEKCTACGVDLKGSSTYI